MKSAPAKNRAEIAAARFKAPARAAPALFSAFIWRRAPPYDPRCPSAPKIVAQAFKCCAGFQVLRRLPARAVARTEPFLLGDRRAIHQVDPPASGLKPEDSAVGRLLL